MTTDANAAEWTARILESSDPIVAAAIRRNERGGPMSDAYIDSEGWVIYRLRALVRRCHGEGRESVARSYGIKQGALAGHEKRAIIYVVREAERAGWDNTPDLRPLLRGYNTGSSVNAMIRTHRAFLIEVLEHLGFRPDIDLRRRKEPSSVRISKLEKALFLAMTAIDDWLSAYAPERGDPARVAQARERIDRAGTVAYIEDVKAEIAAVMGVSETEGDPQ